MLIVYDYTLKSFPQASDCHRSVEKLVDGGVEAAKAPLRRAGVLVRVVTSGITV